MRRRAVALMMTALMTAGLAVTGLTGCGDEGGGRESVRLMVWSPQGDQSKDAGEWLQTCCNRFAELHPEWKITFVYGVADEAGAAGTVSRHRRQQPAAGARPAGGAAVRAKQPPGGRQTRGVRPRNRR